MCIRDRRYDGSNRLGSSTTARWLPTWSFGGSWNVDEENFMKESNVVNYLKLRASYGLTASLGPATNSKIVLRNLNIHRPYTDDVETLIRIANLENSQLTWEKNYTGCLLYTSDAADERSSVDLGGRRI